MCLAVPTRVVEIDQNGMITTDTGGVRKKVSSVLIEDARVNDWVIVHAGFAIQKLDQKEAMEALKLLWEMIEASPEGDGDEW
ncbi:MAG: HypC/HybG/HupF family hydrogenase formation chaperone [Deltaproteobacteria bacterium]|nr:HypC/HybG/HupF family hydrogenase formation chaperone [Deltaproteobacteria bacterium]MBW2086568.1 HypC/HybG/HupF family hydrogenase formation chaperone [Deltaproteobacteria bacterium]